MRLGGEPVGRWGIALLAVTGIAGLLLAWHGWTGRSAGVAPSLAGQAASNGSARGQPGTDGTGQGRPLAELGALCQRHLPDLARSAQRYGQAGPHRAEGRGPPARTGPAGYGRGDRPAAGRAAPVRGRRARLRGGSVPG